MHNNRIQCGMVNTVEIVEITEEFGRVEIQQDRGLVANSQLPGFQMLPDESSVERR